MSLSEDDAGSRAITGTGLALVGGEKECLVRDLGELHTSVSNPAAPLPLPTAVGFYLNQSETQRLV